MTSVVENSPAAQYQLEQDDIIIGVNRKRVKNLAELRAIVEKHKGVLAINVQRGDRTVYLVIR